MDEVDCYVVVGGEDGCVFWELGEVFCEVVGEVGWLVVDNDWLFVDVLWFGLWMEGVFFCFGI